MYYQIGMLQIVLDKEIIPNRICFPFDKNNNIWFIKMFFKLLKSGIKKQKFSYKM